MMQNDAKGRPIYNRLSVNHPLQAVADAPFFATGDITIHIGDATFNRQVSDFIPAAGIPKADPFAFPSLKGSQRDKDLTLDAWGQPVSKQAGTYRIPTI